MSENKMISISSMDKIVKDVEDTVQIDYHGESLIVKKFISFTDMAKFVNEVVEGCFDNDRGVYIPEVKTFLAQINTVLYYSNVRLPDDIKHRYDILTKTDLVSVIAGAVDKVQYQAIIRSIEEKIDYRVRTNEQLFNSKLNTAMSTIEMLLNNIKEYFGDISPDDIQKLLSSLADNKLDEEKLVNAYIASIKDGDDESPSDKSGEPE